MTTTQEARIALINTWLDNVSGSMIALRAWQGFLLETRYQNPPRVDAETMFHLSEALYDALSQLETVKTTIEESDQLDELFRAVTGRETWPFYFEQQIKAAALDTETLRVDIEAYREVDDLAAGRLMALIEERTRPTLVG